MPTILLPVNFPNDSSEPLGSQFEEFHLNHINVPFTNMAHMKEVYISKQTLLDLLENENGPECVGVVFYSAKVRVADPANPNTQMDAMTLAAVGVDARGNLINGEDGSFSIAAPCPPYCPSWG